LLSGNPQHDPQASHVRTASQMCILMTDTLHGLHAGVYPVYRGRISTAHQGDQMFDTLTPDERRMLGNKLADWGHAFARVGNPLAFVALATEDPLTYGPIWTQARRYQETMTEIYEIRTELAA
jgi:hypothetical protein